MKKHYVLVAGVLVVMIMSFISCENKKDDTSDGDTSTEKVVNDQLTPEQTKERLMEVAKQVTGKFNTADQEAAIKLADDLYDKYQDYSLNAFEERYENRYDALFAMPRYAKAVLRGAASPAAMDYRYVFNFPGESAIFEANERARAWEYKGAAPENSLILRCTDAAGRPCEAKMWGEGDTHRLEYTWEEHHWEYPRVYPANLDLIYVYGVGEYNGVWCYFDKDSQGRWYTYDYDGNKLYVSESDIAHFYGYDDYDNYYEYDKEKEAWFYEDYDNGQRVSDGTHTAVVDLPAKIFFTLKQSDTEVIRVEFQQDMQKNDHAYFSVSARVANLSWTSDVKINSTNASVAYVFKYGDETLISAAAKIPSYKLIDKADTQTYDEWIEEYGDRYDELLKQVGSVDAFVDIYDMVQLKGKIDNFSYLYRDIKKLDEGGFWTESREDAQKLVETINAHVSVGLYYGSDIRQASVIAQLARETQYDGDYDWENDTWIDREYEMYYPEGVLYFPQDKTTYAFDQYFNRKPFTDLQYTIEDIANKYIKLSGYLYDEVGEVSF